MLTQPLFLMRFPSRCLLGSAVALGFAAFVHAESKLPPALMLMPAPATLSWQAARLPIGPELTIRLQAGNDVRVTGALHRLLVAWQERTGFTFAREANGGFTLQSGPGGVPANLTISVANPATTGPAMAGIPLPRLGDDERYTLEVNRNGAELKAATPLGAVRGLATLRQLLQSDEHGWFLPAVTIEDHPRFPWRGLMIDVCRHWMPMDVIKRNLEAMALVKLNVLHLHLTEDQGFRIESKKLPQLHQKGSDGLYFTQDQIREIIAFAAERGIRVVPEFDIPGHATSWLVAFPELGSAPGPYVIERKWGIFDPVLDPTNEATYAMLETFLGEMAALFPDPYLHIGGDENNGKHWNANPRIQAFIKEHKLHDNEGLHAYFNRRVRDILVKHGKKLVGWDEILHPDLPKDSVIHSWRGAEGLAKAAREGYTSILSNGYYIDLNYPASDHYRNDPLPENNGLTPEQQKLILGGEATMWSEWVTPEIVDSRLWPRTAAIAERLWSPREVNDVADMYRRLAIVSQRLAEAGTQHERNRSSMVWRFAGDNASPELLSAVSVLVDAVEPVKQYTRGGQQPHMTQHSPLTGLIDMARPESDVSRNFGEIVKLLQAGGSSPGPAADDAHEQLVQWHTAAEVILSAAADTSPRVVAEARPAAKALLRVCEIGLQALELKASGGAVPAVADEEWKQLTQPGNGVYLPMAAHVRELAR